MKDPRALIAPLRRIHEEIRDAVVLACEEAAADDLSRIDHEDESGDTIYAVDRVSEDRLLGLVERELGSFGPIVVVAEGLPGGRAMVPEGRSEEEAGLRVIVDPIDGTRGLMYQKRSAWILTGVAPNRGPATSLRDVVAAVQTEVPLVKQHLADTLWAVRGEGAAAERYNRLSGQRTPLRLLPSTAPTIAHGFAMVARFFPGAREELAAIDEEIVAGALGPVRPGKAHCFEDQYISTGGQLYELMAGHDRFVADLRPLLERVLARRGLALGICCHPYDLATELIAREMGVIVTGATGAPLDAPLDVDADVTWIGYANESIRDQVQPLLQAALARRGMA
ncbi:MAG: inositol monophosphatase [Solirubrobacterales bacterium]|jgi:fructose-1,6-bisphosphatase/inositol monophosphatase family enzyme